MNEVAFQKKLVDLFNTMDVMAFKTSHRFMVGLPDLFIKSKSLPGLFLEIKRDMARGDIISGKLSAMQIKVMRDMRRHGQPVGWLVFRPNMQGRHMMVWGKYWDEGGRIGGKWDEATPMPESKADKHGLLESIIFNLTR